MKNLNEESDRSIKKRPYMVDTNKFTVAGNIKEFNGITSEGTPLDAKLTSELNRGEVVRVSSADGSSWVYFLNGEKGVESDLFL